MFWPGRRLRKLAHRTALGLILCLLILRAIHDRHDAVVRESPVDFSILHKRGDQSLRPPERPVRKFNGSHIDDRYHYQRTLQAGWQGSVYLYHDTLSIPPKLVIVKTISAVARNKLPPQLLPAFKHTTSTWPSEIDASLSITAATPEANSPFVSVHDFFLLQNAPPEEQDWAWALVTPFISGGTLVDLAKDARSVGRTHDIDQTYRSTFYRLLRDLRSLHENGFCHDDVKLQNIFVESPKRWLLGDLGNTRQVDHAWHRTRLWKRRDQWSDCRLNDIRKALKSYMTFLREASHDREQFDLDFLDGSTAWAQMYWTFMHDPASASSTMTAEGGPGNVTADATPVWGDGPPKWYSRAVHRSLRAKAVKQELLCSPLWWKLWFTF